MALQPGQGAPDFEQASTQGKIRFHKRLGNAGGVLFGHPKDYTPVRITELAEWRGFGPAGAQFPGHR